jgi:hypothetical protein
MKLINVTAAANDISDEALMQIATGFERTEAESTPAPSASRLINLPAI